MKSQTVFAAAALILSACAPAEYAPPDDGSPLRAGEITPPLPKPTFTLTDQTGTPFDFRAETDGFVTLLFFGYTHCPDICPLHMSRIGQALREVDPRVAARVKVVFVTADPDRDTEERIGEWLSAFHPSFIGLRGTVEDIEGVIDQIPLFMMPRIEVTGTDQYGVSHPSGVIGFSPDNQGRFIYFGGPRAGSKEDFVHDLPLIAFRDFTEE